MINEIAKEVKEEIRRMANWINGQVWDERQIEKVVKAILDAQDNKGNNKKKIFLAGLGRSGFVAKGFAMRLAHLGFNAHAIDEPTVPPFEKEDLFIIVSGSGASLIHQIETALDIGAEIIVITSFTDSVGARLANIKLIIAGRKKEEGLSLSYDERQMRGLPIFPLGTAFEVLAMIVLDAIISIVVMEKKKTEEDLKKRHSNVPEI